MTNRIVFCFAVLCFTACSSCAQNRQTAQPQQADETKKIQTKLEAFLGRKGTVLIKQFAEIGEVRGLGSAKVTAVILTEANHEADTVKGIRIDTQESGSLERQESSFLDMDEIDGAIKAVDYMRNAAEKFNDGGQREIVYVTKGNFSLGIFTRKKGGDWSGYTSSGRIAGVNCFLGLAELDKMKGMLQEGQKVLNSH